MEVVLDEPFCLLNLIESQRQSRSFWYPPKNLQNTVSDAKHIQNDNGITSTFLHEHEGRRLKSVKIISQQ